MRLSKVLKDYRWANKLSVRELAKEIGFSAATLSRLETHDKDLTGENLAKVLQWLLEREQRREGE